MDGRANRTHWWTERWLRLWVALSLSLSLSPSLSLSRSLIFLSSLTHLSFFSHSSFFLSHSFYPILSLSLSCYLNVDIVFITLPQTFSGREAFQTFCLRNVLRATAACTFSTSQRPKVLRTWGVLRIFIWKYASRRSGVLFLNIFDLSSDQMAPRPPLRRAYCSTLRSLKT